MGPLVSIIIPYRNQIEWLGRCLKSCVEQTYPHIEIILVDDFSNEDLDGVLAPYGGRVRYRRLDRHEGPGAARNAGFSMARGQFVQFLDADDFIDPRKIEIQLDGLRSTGSDMALSRWRQMLSVGGMNLPWPVKIPPPARDLLRETIRDGANWFPIMACLFPKGFIERVGPWPTRAQNEDREFRYSLLKLAPRIIFNEDCLFFYRRYPAAAQLRRVMADGDAKAESLRCDCDFLSRILHDLESGSLSPEEAGSAGELAASFMLAYSRFDGKERLEGLVARANRILRKRSLPGVVPRVPKSGIYALYRHAMAQAIPGLARLLPESKRLDFLVGQRLFRNLMKSWIIKSLNAQSRRQPAESR